MAFADFQAKQRQNKQSAIVREYFSKRNGKVNEYKNHSRRERQHEVVITASVFHFSPVYFPAQEACSIVF